MTIIAIWLGKIVLRISSFLHLGAGGTWPGEIALMLDSRFIQKVSQQFKKGIVIVVGTNGKTTTSLMIAHCLQLRGDTVVHNTTGANLLNGIASSLIHNSNWLGAITADWAVFEVDENTFPLLAREISGVNKNIAVVFLNLFRDQLDRYGEVDVIAQKWEKALALLGRQISLVVNADDPLLVYLTQGQPQIHYFGLANSKHYLKDVEHATDSLYCMHCGSKLVYKGIYFSHLGDWQCTNCGFSKPQLEHKGHQSPLHGVYNLYNTLATYSLLENSGLSSQEIAQSLTTFKAAFGRQEELEWNGRKIQLYLSKNPAGFNASLRTVIEQKPKSILLVLNDRVPDGRDVSWIWDVDFEMIPKFTQVTISGDRVYDMGVRIKYANLVQKPNVIPNLEKALNVSLSHISNSDVLYILSTYSAMLEVRQILTGKKIL